MHRWNAGVALVLTLEKRARTHADFCRYRTCCPKDCPAATDPSKITPRCMAHRRKRWSCCDRTAQGKGGSTGCAFRYHLPPDAAPMYFGRVAILS